MTASYINVDFSVKESFYTKGFTNHLSSFGHKVGVSDWNVPFLPSSSYIGCPVLRALSLKPPWEFPLFRNETFVFTIFMGRFPASLICSQSARVASMPCNLLLTRLPFLDCYQGHEGVAFVRRNLDVCEQCMGRLQTGQLEAGCAGPGQCPGQVQRQWVHEGALEKHQHG